ncbi:RnfABCDGE type electron transport complex subunit D [Clostridium tarantellae]|uniref:Ion-translocating oxidoreductase complex subunit D n=1 Tax=Clostridium tarantellae TaxID=39493 RepID=A0A6I1MMN9_9CLOT|nr:RnfABCDGE type electron transport complex subunit D [Clostridium tarantellae]MPQ43397.1 Na+-transporting NADH:ubiquinone oxidoreductase subunit D [Clostridium tarantellae]
MDNTLNNLNLDNNKDFKLLKSKAPHIKSPITTQKIMLDVIIALIPTTIAGIYFFGIKSLFLIIISIFFAILSEFIFQKLTHKEITISDLSAAVTGLLLALNLPVTTPLWIVAIGSIIAIILVKQCFGGLGFNFMNPALAARAFILSAWPESISNYTLDGITTATPLTYIKNGEASIISLSDAFVGNIPGCIGEVSALALIIGGIYLLYRKVITWHIPITYISTVFLLTTIIGRDVYLKENGFYEILTGGLLIGAIFMATDYTTSPMTKSGQVVFAFGCGLITSLIRIFGGYPEGVSYAIILMNLTVPIIDHYIIPKSFGFTKSLKHY